MATVRLQSNTRLFTNHAGVLLSRIDACAAAGSTLNVLDRRLMVYDHRDQDAIKIQTDEGERWILIEESGIELNS